MNYVSEHTALWKYDFDQLNKLKKSLETGFEKFTFRIIEGMDRFSKHVEVNCDGVFVARTEYPSEIKKIIEAHKVKMKQSAEKSKRSLKVQLLRRRRSRDLSLRA